MSDPIFNGNNPYPYFTCDQDPTSSEPAVTAIGIPNDWMFWWWNTATGDIFFNTQNIENDLIWKKVNYLVITAAQHIGNAINNLQTNYNNLSILSLSKALNSTNIALNDMANKFNTLLGHLRDQGLQLPPN